MEVFQFQTESNWIFSEISYFLKAAFFSSETQKSADFSPSRIATAVWAVEGIYDLRPAHLMIRLFLYKKVHPSVGRLFVFLKYCRYRRVAMVLCSLSPTPYPWPLLVHPYQITQKASTVV